MSRGTLDPVLSFPLSGTGLSPSLAGFPKTSLLAVMNQLCGPNPEVHALRFALFPFRSPLLWKSMFSFFSSGYLDVSVHRVPSVYLCIQYTVTAHYHCRVSPFGHLRVKVCLRLSAAFRSLPRPSSALDAKAFTLRS